MKVKLKHFNNLLGINFKNYWMRKLKSTKLLVNTSKKKKNYFNMSHNYNIDYNDNNREIKK